MERRFTSVETLWVSSTRRRDSTSWKSSKCGPPGKMPPLSWGDELISSSVTGHFSHPYSRPWKHVDRPLTSHLAGLVGAKEEEVAHTSTLTSNMHNLFTSFYRPTSTRWKIVIEQGSFPSDWVSITSPCNGGCSSYISMQPTPIPDCMTRFCLLPR
jgi:kynureninase